MNPPQNKFDAETVRRFRDSRPQAVDDSSRFQNDSLTSSTNPYQRMPSRRDVPGEIRGRAKMALSCLIMKGSAPNARIVICQSTPQWVADVVNRATGDSGILDSWRQQFIREALRMIKAGSPPSVARSESNKRLKKWASAGRQRYISSAKEVLPPDVEDTEVLALGQRLEKFEVYFQVYEQLMQAPYDGRLYDFQWQSKMHSREPEPSETRAS